MFTGIAVIGVLAGSLASLFNLDQPSDDRDPTTATPTPPVDQDFIRAELEAFRVQLRTVDTRLEKLVELTRTRPDGGE
jgi:hypothetical protein